MCYGLKQNILSKVIVNGMSGSSWRFRRFAMINLKVLNLDMVIVKQNVRIYWLWGKCWRYEPKLRVTKSFIDDEKIEGDRTFYYKFENVTASIDDVLKQEYDKSMDGIENIDLSNFCETSEEQTQLDEFKDSEQRIEKFNETLFPVSSDNDVNQNDYNSFINAIFFAIRYDLEQKTELCIVDELKELIDKNLFVQLNQKKIG